MGTQFKTVGAGSLVALAITLLLIGLYLKEETKENGRLEQGIEGVEQSKEIKMILDSRAAEENAVMDQLP
ncbi:MAG: hypothetical protein A2408_01435 [Candidatus Yonathbacteria bacterium RIFOXYC1_FULL_52_10]|uniref:Uncharacterized protein n=1 Tax=Candidatus Yonathbacteria bacterium RIFOXYD1_FULL_52_36 TaxID=1802730 RepID=A0A1G2SJI9_9BACT|nr:MAG: hypothetical protein A2591_01080 [Candidatus Yonathbacteria bacterium RIFOXYD1_FULL_52_36]OHA85550.1 MAG: hypothetical protein A2408_01435 [Candidatus Yonathbacteria bacterium RIFOXYC1_FULL_52_10]